MQSIGLTQPNGQSPSPRLLSPLLAGGLRGGRTEGGVGGASPASSAERESRFAGRGSR